MAILCGALSRTLASLDLETLRTVFQEDNILCMYYTLIAIASVAGCGRAGWGRAGRWVFWILISRGSVKVTPSPDDQGRAEEGSVKVTPRGGANADHSGGGGQPMIYTAAPIIFPGCMPPLPLPPSPPPPPPPLSCPAPPSLPPPPPPCPALPCPSLASPPLTAPSSSTLPCPALPLTGPPLIRHAPSCPAPPCPACSFNLLPTPPCLPTPSCARGRRVWWCLMGGAGSMGPPPSMCSSSSWIMQGTSVWPPRSVLRGWLGRGRGVLTLIGVRECRWGAGCWSDHRGHGAGMRVFNTMFRFPSGCAEHIPWLAGAGGHTHTCCWGSTI